MQWMALGNSWFALIIPAIVILYLLKRKVEDRVVPSTLLWQRTMQNWEAVRPWERLRRNLLLFLQLLAALLLVLALMRLAIPTQGIADQHTILVVENSGSMLATEGEGTRFDRAVHAATQLVEKLGSGQVMTLIEAGRQPRVLLAQSGDRDAILQAIRSITPQMGSTDTSAALSLAGAIAANEAGSGVVWLGDGRSERLSDTSTPTVFPGPFRFMQMGLFRENSAIGVFVTQPGKSGVEGLLRIDNQGTQPSSGKVMVYNGENQLLDSEEFSVAAGSSQTLSFSSLPQAPVYRARIEPEQDGLIQDNERWSVPFAAGVGKAVLVSPQGNRFLHQALQTVGRLDVETQQHMPDQTTQARDIWVFDGVLPEQLPEGNILLIAPERATSWLPYKGVAELEQQPQTVVPDDPLMKYVDWRDVHVAKAAVLDEMPGMKTLVRAGNRDLIKAGMMEGRRVVIVAFDLHQSDLPLRPAFPIFMQNSISWLSPTQASPIGQASVGEVLNVPLTPGGTQRSLVYPDGHKQVIEAQGTSWLFQVPDQIGLYRLDEQLESGLQSRYFAVHLSEQESDITPRFIAVGASGGQPAEGDGTTAPEPLGSRELTNWLVALALLVVFVEWRVYQRGY